MNHVTVRLSSAHFAGIARIARPLFALALLFSATACGDAAKSDDTAAGTAQQAASAPLSESMHGPGARSGEWSGVDSRSRWSAVLDGSRVTQLDELAIFTDSTRAMRQFRFDTAGVLVGVHEERVQVLFGEKATPDTLITILDLEWIADSLVRSAKRVNNVDKLIQPYEVDNARAHASDLLQTVRAGASPRAPGH